MSEQTMTQTEAMLCRQRAWQLRQQKQGLCHLCNTAVARWPDGAPKRLCPDHITKQKERLRKKKAVQ